MMVELIRRPLTSAAPHAAAKARKAGGSRIPPLEFGVWIFGTELSDESSCFCLRKAGSTQRHLYQSQVFNAPHVPAFRVWPINEAAAHGAKP